MPLSEIAAIRAASVGTLNDVLLAVLILTLRRYTAAHARSGPRRVRILVPFNTRRPENMARLGVNISLVPVDLDLSITDPSRLLKYVESKTRTLKEAHMARAINLMSACLSALPGPMKPLAGWLLSNPLPFLPWNVNSTNVPGPTEPLYLLGRKMVACYPYLPLIPFGTRAGLTCAFYSYNGWLYCGFTGDVAAMPDLDRFCQLFELSYAEFRDACRAGAKGKRLGSPRPAARRRH
jgi:diacylglycerol O-acyltransferase